MNLQQDHSAIAEVINDPSFNGGYFGSVTHTIVWTIIGGLSVTGIIFAALVVAPMNERIDTAIASGLITAPIWFALLKLYAKSERKDFIKMSKSVDIENEVEETIKDLDKEGLKCKKHIKAIEKCQKKGKRLGDKQFTKMLDDIKIKCA
ncbi:hypothetical protein A3715_19105 [Oleiphilus sp. HI0009]|nr:hypothetical protein A3715_19105 [Oleiphilus sp. HI0009]